MNIFATSRSAYDSAQALDDKRVIKMIAETTQMLCTAARVRGHEVEGPRSTHENHPCTKWATRSSRNFLWLLQHLSELHSEKQRRWPGNLRHGWHPIFYDLCEIFDNGMRDRWCSESRRTPFVNCARNTTLGLDFTHVQPVTDAYREYLNARWATDVRAPKWTRRGPPAWANSFAPMEDSI